MPKTKMRYLIRFGEKNANGRVYDRNSIDASSIKPMYLVHNEAPPTLPYSKIGQCSGTCQIKIDDAGVYMNGFKFARDSSKPSEPLTQNAKTVIALMCGRAPVYPVTAFVGNINEDGVVENCRIVSVFFTPTPAFEQPKKNRG